MKGNDSKLQIANNLYWLFIFHKLLVEGKKSHSMYLFYSKQCYRLQRVAQLSLVCAC